MDCIYPELDIFRYAAKPSVCRPAIMNPDVTIHSYEILKSYQSPSLHITAAKRIDGFDYNFDFDVLAKSDIDLEHLIEFIEIKKEIDSSENTNKFLRIA
ncbi:MAG: hypothetical protein ACOC32_02970 [Nanoarchaeota archaeon]